MALKQFQHLPAQPGPLRAFTMSFPDVLEHRLLVGTLAQWRQLQGQAADAVVQVFAKQAIGDVLAQRTVGCRNQADIHRISLAAAHRLYATFLQHPQQAGLGRQRHVTDFIEKQRALVGLADQSDMAFLVGTGKGAFLVAEQLRFHQFRRNGRAVHRDQRLCGPRAGPVQGLDENFLADPCLAVDQQGNAFLLQALGLSNGFFHPVVAPMQGLET